VISRGGGTVGGKWGEVIEGGNGGASESAPFLFWFLFSSEGVNKEREGKDQG
jgi:hypothetical protein